MQPNPPTAPNRYGPPPPRHSGNTGVVFGVLALLAFIYLVDHGTKGEAAVFGGVDRHIAAQDFHEGQCTAVFGGCKIDLRDAQIQGSEATMSTYAIFGGVEIRVPDDWEIVIHNTSIFGGVADHTRQPSRGPGTKTLVLDGVTIFGGTSVKN